MKTKTADLTGLALNYAVAVAEGGTGLWHDTVSTWWIQIGLEDRALKNGWAQAFTPSTDWSQGGPIAERERIWVRFPFGDEGEVEAIHGRFAFPNIVNAFGPTELVARMRCYVLSKLGAEVDVPQALL